MFPFLAVLLCVMGALLLILFVMDRRAKIAAQHTVNEMKSARLERTKAEEDARKAEWEKAKDALHQSLVAQQDLLKAEAKDLHSNLVDANKKLELAAMKDADLKKQSAEESEKIALLQVEITNQQHGAKESSKKETVSKAELLEAAKELADLEYAFKKLRALKENEGKTYSLVPYRGKRGDMRPPIYVECVGDGIVFHPEMKLLTGPYFTVSSVRNEIEQRAGPLMLEKSTKEKVGQTAETKSQSYVLFLVRPNGIENYYKAQSYLKGYQLDFGYELVDQHWALDFGAPPSVAPPVQLANANVPPKVSAPGPLMLPANPGQIGNSPTPGNGQIGPPPGVGIVNTPPIAPPPGIGGANGGSPSQVTPQFGTTSPLVATLPLTVPSSGNTTLPSPSQSGQGVGTPSIGLSPTIGMPSTIGVDTGLPVKSPSFVPIARMAPPIPIASTGDGSNVAQRELSVNPPTGNGNGSGNASPYPMTTGVTGNPSSNPIATTGNPNSGTSTPTNPNGTIANNPASATGMPPTDGNAGESSTPPQFPGTGDANLTQEAPSGPPVRPLPDFGNTPAPAKKAPAAPPLGRVLGNKDFVITIDCHGDHVSVVPGGMTFRWNTANVKATDQALVQAIKNLIAKRQASVRPGEPAYRPIIRFHVSAEGLRTYYQAYPLLESLGVAMRRENVDD